MKLFYVAIVLLFSCQSKNRERTTQPIQIEIDTIKDKFQDSIQELSGDIEKSLSYNEYKDSLVNDWLDTKPDSIYTYYWIEQDKWVELQYSNSMLAMCYFTDGNPDGSDSNWYYVGRILEPYQLLMLQDTSESRSLQSDRLSEGTYLRLQTTYKKYLIIQQPEASKVAKNN